MKFGTEDIGENLYWCDKGRAYECTETATCVETADPETGDVTLSDCTRPTCSSNTPSSDTYGVWSLLRAAAETETFDLSAFAELEEDWFGEPEVYFVEGESACMEDLTFRPSGAWDDITITDATGKITITDGIVCTNDADIARRAFNTQVTVSAALPSDPTDYPRNVYIAD